MLVPAAANPAPPPPSTATVRREVARAERSSKLWATLNECRGDTVGVRAQLPALSFATHLELRATVEAWSPTRHRYVPIAKPFALGGQVLSGSRTLQAGVTLHSPTPVTVIASVTFAWVRDGRTLGSIVRPTSAGHPDDHGTPARTSLAQCSIS